MDTESEGLYFQKLEELIQDDDKIVTIPHLAKTLNISVKDSEILLSKYVKNQRKLKPNELGVTYILIGKLSNRGRGVFWVKEDEFKEKKSLFSELESEVLFSVQKSKQTDFNVINLVDDLNSPCEAPLLGSIVGKNCIKRILKVKKVQTPPPSTVKGKSSFFLPKTESSSSTDKSVPSLSNQDSKSKKGGISDLFNKAAASQTKEASQKKSTSSLIKTNKGGLTAFFSKGSSSSIKSENGVEKGKTAFLSKGPSSSSIKSQNGIKIENTESHTSETDELMEVDICESLKSEKDDSKEEVKKAPKKETKKKEKKTKNKRQRDNSEENTTKKRKRIVERIDSESDDMFENDEDVIENSDHEPERLPSPVGKQPLAAKNKIKKAVDKSFMDDEGFIVTKTEYIYESAPEDDDVVPVKKEETKPKLEKKTSASSENDISPSKGAKTKKGKKNNMQNQPTLMNFFKRT